MTTTLVSWNIAKRHRPWRELDSMAEVDVALLQEAGKPPVGLSERVRQGPREHYDSHRWNSHWYEGRFRRLFDRWAKVVQCSDRVRVEWFKQVSPISEVRADEIAVSGIGTIAAARVIPLDSDTQPFIVVSMYARWMRPHPSTGSSWRVGTPDASAHRIISDLSAFVGDTDPASHRIIAAGDLNMAYKLPPDRPGSFAERERTIFTRMEALGMEFLGPRHPHGRRADPPHDPRNVPTYHSSQREPATAEHQLDYVFASRGLHESVSVRALNAVEDWGSSDHCRIVIDVD
ncbi:MAG: endonuclease/exonuclease/phosphatase family protein [Chloroflexi bacterium]|nr:endonuclease/exonuclease/phosphatase family protein [Chloroflexota bacterium]